MRRVTLSDFNLEDFIMTKENPPSKPVPDSSQPKGTSKGAGTAPGPSSQKGTTKG